MDLASLTQSTQVRALPDGNGAPFGRILPFPSAISPIPYAVSILSSRCRPYTSRTNHLIRAYAEHSDGPRRALSLVSPFRLRGLDPGSDSHCRGREVQALALTSGRESETFSQNRPVCVYSAFGDLEGAVLLMELMVKDGIDPNEATLISVLRKCVELKELSFGRKVHEVAMRSGLHREVKVANALLKMYAKCGCIDTARKVFDETPERNVFVWNSMIQGLVGHGRCREALELFLSMRDAGVEHNQGTITVVLKACSQLGELSLGKEVHGVAKKNGLYRRTDVATALLDMYAKCGFIDNAREVFDEMSERNVVSWTAIIAGLVGHDRCQEALELFLRMRDVVGVEPNEKTITVVLKACTQLGDLSLGKELHEIAKKKGLHRMTYVATALLDMYAKCGCIDEAREVFDEMLERDVVSWTAIIAGLVGHGRCQESLELFLSMRNVEGVEPNEKTITAVLKACVQLGDLSLGKEVHEIAKKKGLHKMACVATALLDMYVKCGCIDTAREIFEEMPEKNVVPWTAMIAGLVGHGQCQEALELFLDMRDVEGVEPNEKTITAVLKASAQLGDLSLGKEVHEIAKKKGLHQMSYVASALLDMYVKCGCIDNAKEVFDEMSKREVVSWTAIIAGLVGHGRYLESLELFLNMRDVEGLEPDEKIIATVLKACAQLGELSLGKLVHGVAKNNGLHQMTCVATALLDLYAKCGCIDNAWEVFDEMSERNVVSWTAIIAGLVDHGRCQEALELFLSMRDVEGVEPNEKTITVVLRACAQLGDLNLGKEVHEIAKKKGLHQMSYVATALLGMYVKCGCIDTAREIFEEMPEKNVVSWTAMIAGLMGHGQCQEALELFLRMRDVEGLEPNEKTITAVLKACALVGDLSLGKEVHAIAKKKGLHQMTYVATALLDMYAKCGCIDNAREVFDEMSKRDLVSWTAIIAGLVGHGQCLEALELFLNMRNVEGLEPDEKIIATVLKACAQLGDLSLGKLVHGVAKNNKLHRRTNVATAMLNMYAKCGCIDTAREVFDEMLERDVVSWNAMIAGLVSYGRCREALELFLSMRDVDRVQPNEKTITAVLKACAQLGELSLGKEMHGVARKNGLRRRNSVSNSPVDMYVKCGCTDNAREVFNEMSERDMISWNAMITGLVGHGQCQEALELFLSMRDVEGVEPNEKTIIAVLKACVRLGNLSLGKEVHEICKKKGLHQIKYVSTSLLDMYIKCGCIDAAREVFEEMSEKNVVAWTAMIVGLVGHGRCQEALELFLGMRDVVGLEPNEKTITMVLNACTALGELLLGREVHDIVKEEWASM